MNLNHFQKSRFHIMKSIEKRIGFEVKKKGQYVDFERVCIEDLPGEIWKKLEDYRNCWVSNKGRFKAERADGTYREIRTDYSNENYCRVSLTKTDGTRPREQAHH